MKREFDILFPHPRINNNYMQIIESKRTMRKMLLLSLFLATSVSCVPMDTGSTVTGASLYSEHCTVCHGAGEDSSKAGADASRIMGGITNVPEMRALNILSSKEIELLAEYLVGLNPQPVIPDGYTLYNANCAGCHGPADSTDKAGASATRISNAIASVPAMSTFSTLSNADIQALAEFLANATPPPPSADGFTLYVENCVDCHGPADASDKVGADVTRIVNAIETVSAMSIFSTLSITEIQAIADYLASSSPPPLSADGITLYTSNCSGCHGPADASNKAGANFTRIINAIEIVPGMNALSFLTYEEIQAIADFLFSASAPVP